MNVRMVPSPATLLYKPIIVLYSTLMELCALVLPVVALVRPRNNWDIADRRGLPPRAPAGAGGSGEVTWIHAASLGESKLVLKYVSLFRMRPQPRRYLLTATTRSAVRYLRDHATEEVVSVGYLPFDTVRLMGGIMDRFGISRVWLMELELWPSLLLSCIRRNVPVGVLNGRIERSSFSSYRRLRVVFSPLVRYLNPVLVQNEQYAEWFRHLGASADAVRVTGNLKRLVRITPVSPGIRESLRSRINLNGSQAVLTAGCIHPGEANVVMEALGLLKKAGRAVKCIVVPRHFHAVPAILHQLPPGTLHLTDAVTEETWTTCLIEKFGILDDLYSIADIALVGGTFVSVGGHNVWEAAQFGIPVLFGPDFHTQHECCSLLIRSGMGSVAEDAAALAGHIERLLDEAPETRRRRVEAFADTLEHTHSQPEVFLP